MKGRAIRYSAAELEWLEANRLMVISDYARAFAERFGRSDVSDVNLHSLRKRRGWKTGRTGCFAKGQEPHNKGKKCEPGKGGLHPNARRTQFRKGHLPHNSNYLGHERVDPKDGYVYISVAAGFERRYVLKHKWAWEQKNGALPENHALKCLNGNRQDCDPDNWTAVPRALLPRLAGGNRYRRVLAFDEAAPEVRPTILAIAELEHKARTAIATEARRAETTKIGSVHEGAGRKASPAPTPHQDSQRREG